jgi:hypothetical protein
MMEKELHMQNSTLIEYLKLAHHFFTTHFDEEPDIEATIHKLLELAPSYRPAYWRRLRRGLTLYFLKQHQIEEATRIRSLSNPTTMVGGTTQKKSKQRRIKRVTEQDHAKLVQHLKEQGDLPCLAAVMIVEMTGCRPAELNAISLLGNQTINIISAKKIGEVRGCDRMLKLSEKSYAILELLLPHIHHADQRATSDISRIQRRLQRHVKNLWPKRKARISLYSYRHQMGANLKATGMNGYEISTILGHKSDASISVYGDPRTARAFTPPRLVSESVKRANLWV